MLRWNDTRPCFLPPPVPWQPPHLELAGCHHLPVARCGHKRGRQKQNACISTLTQALFITRSA
jgi:hypothetical protein